MSDRPTGEDSLMADMDELLTERDRLHILGMGFPPVLDAVEDILAEKLVTLRCQEREAANAAMNAAVNRAASHFRQHGYDEFNLRRLLTVESPSKP